MAAALLLLAGSIHAATVFQNIIDNTDPTFNQALAINNAGLIAGYFGNGTTNPNKGYTVGPPYAQANFTNENFPGSVQTQVTGINNLGSTVGFWVDGAGANHGFTDIGNTFTNVDDPNSNASPIFTQLLGLNDLGLAAGFYNDSADVSHAFTYNIGTPAFTPLTPPGSTSATATDVNNTGEVSGFFTDGAGNTLGFVFTGTSYIAYDVPGSTFTQFFGINNTGQAVGVYIDASNVQHGLVYDIAHNTFQTVDDPFGVGSTTLNGANDTGKLVGFYVDANDNTIGLLATTVPEPTTFVLLGVGTLLIAIRYLIGRSSARNR